MVDWKRIKAEYISGGTSYRKLAEKYGVSFTTLSRTALREKWADLRQQADDKATTKIVETISDKEADRVDKIIDVADKLLDKIAEVIDVVVDTQGIRHLTSALKDIKDIKGIKSDRDIREQEARIKKLQMEAEKEELHEDREVNVVFDNDIEKYSK